MESKKYNKLSKYRKKKKKKQTHKNRELVVASWGDGQQYRDGRLGSTGYWVLRQAQGYWYNMENKANIWE